MGKTNKVQFLAKEVIGDKYMRDAFFKRKVGVHKQVSLLQRNIIFGRVKKYNEFYGTSFWITYQQVGEADLYELIEVRNLATPMPTNKPTGRKRVSKPKKDAPHDEWRDATFYNH